MAIYRAALVWILRGAAAAIAVMSALRFYQATKAYDLTRASNDASWEAGLVTPLEMLPELIVTTGAAAVLCLTFAEILSLLARPRQS